jgi:RNA polymerase sigma factor (sigma-70 family)
VVEPDKISDSNDMHTAIAITVNRLSRRYRKWVESEDLTQHLWEYAWKKRDQFAEYLSREDKEEQKQGWAALLVALQRAGDRYCRKEKADRSGYRTEDEAFYTKSMIEDLISMLYNGVGITNIIDDRVKVKTAPGSGYAVETSMADVEMALKYLDAEDRSLLIEAYGYQVTEATLAQNLGVSRSTVERRLAKACKKMVEFLGGPSPY